MHIVREKICQEIYDIVDCGITMKNVGVLGELVDMYKDLEEAKYYKEKSKLVESQITDSVTEKLKEVCGMIEASGKGTAVDNKKLETDIGELMEVAEKIRSIMSMVKLPEPLGSRYKAVYK